jgi:tetratricopeptide (TPR) repeat protein
MDESVLPSDKTFSLALKADQSGDYAKARELYQNIISHDGSYRPALINLGSLCSRMEQLDEALVFYNKASLIEDDYLVWFNIGSVLYKKGTFKESVIALEKSRRLNPLFVLSILVMGLAYSKDGKSTAAAGCFSEVLSLEPDNQVALTALAIIYFDKRKYNLALFYADAAINNNSSSISVRKLRSKILLSFGRTKESATEYHKIIREDKAFKRFDAFVKKIPADTFIDSKGTIEEKIETLERKLDNATPRDLVALSLCCLFNGESDKAIDYLFKVKE